MCPHSSDVIRRLLCSRNDNEVHLSYQHITGVMPSSMTTITFFCLLFQSSVFIYIKFSVECWLLPYDFLEIQDQQINFFSCHDCVSMKNVRLYDLLVCSLYTSFFFDAFYDFSPPITFIFQQWIFVSSDSLLSNCYTKCAFCMRFSHFNWL